MCWTARPKQTSEDGITRITHALMHTEANDPDYAPLILQH